MLIPCSACFEFASRWTDTTHNYLRAFAVEFHKSPRGRKQQSLEGREARGELDDKKAFMDQMS